MGILRDIRTSGSATMAFVAMGMGWAAFAAQVPVIKAQINASDAEFGLSFLISSLGALAAMWLSLRAERWLGARALPVVTAAMAAGFVIAGFSGSFAVFTFVMLLVAAASGVSDVLMNARISEVEAATRRPLMSLNHAIFSFAYAGMAILTGLAREAGLGPVAIFGAIFAVTALMCLRMRQTPAHVDPDGAAPPPASAQGLVVLGGIVVLAAFFSEQAVEGWSALHLERTLGGGAAEGSLGPAVLGLTMGFGRLFGHALAARVADTVMIGAACLISAAGLAVAATAPSVVLAYLGFGIMGLGISVVVPLAMALVGRAVPERDRVAAIGRASVIGYGAFFIGPSVMGLTSDYYGLSAAFLVVAAVLVAVAVGVVPMIARLLVRAG